MKKGSLAVKQIIEYAQEIGIGKSETFLLEDMDQLVVIVKENKEKTRLIKEATSIGVSPFYVEELDIMTLSITPGPDENNAIHILLPTNKIVLDQLFSIVENKKGIEFYVVSEDMELIAARKVLANTDSCDELHRQLNQLEEVRMKQN